MARPTKDQTRRFRDLIASLEPAMQRAFAQAVASLYAGADWRALNAALEAGDVDAAVAALNIDNGAFIGLFQQYQASYFAGANETVATLGISGVTKSDAVGIRFDMTNPRAEARLATAAGEMIQQVSDDTKRAVSETILAGYQQGRGPRDIATDIAGRVVSGRRQGGVLGLDSGRSHRYMAVLDAIKTPEGIKSIVVRKADGSLALKYKVNADTEKRILAAYKKGTAVSPAGQQIIANRYKNALLKSRADTVAQVETSQAVMGGREEEWRQVCEKLGRDPSEVEKTFRHGSGGMDPRWYHVAMHNVTITGLDTEFDFPNGSKLRYAHDPMGDIRDTANCSCDTRFYLPPRREDLL